jgi:hypothetical protein
MIEHLLGTWRLIVYERHAADGSVSFPMGSDALGYLAYTGDGYVFMSMMRPERSALTAQWEAAALEDKGRAATEFVAYCGRYEIDADHLVHHIEQSLRPELVGTDQLRYPTVDGDRLSIIDQPIGVGRTSWRRAVWQRAAAIPGDHAE